MKTGLVLEGGAMRGIFTAGVIDVLLENDICFDGVIGVSAGACFGCNYVSKQIGRTLRYNLKYCKDPRYCSVRSLIKTGDMFGADFCYHDIPETLDPFDTETFIASSTDFYVVATDIESGEPVYKKMTDCKGEDLEWIRASASMPLASRIVEINDGKYLDGGIADSIPLEAFQKLGYEKNVVVLTRPDGYKKSPNKMLPIIRKTYKDYPNLIEAMSKRHLVYNNSIGYVKNQVNAGNTLVICPDEPLPIGRISHDPREIRKVYRMGRRTAKLKLKEIIEFLN